MICLFRILTWYFLLCVILWGVSLLRQMGIASGILPKNYGGIVWLNTIEIIIFLPLYVMSVPFWKLFEAIGLVNPNQGSPVHLPVLKPAAYAIVMITYLGVIKFIMILLKKGA